MALWTVRAAWDDEAGVWFALDSDIPGLAADAPTVEDLAAKAVAMLPTCSTSMRAISEARTF